MKNLLKLRGAQQLGKQEQQAISGGSRNGCISIAKKQRCQNHCCPTGYCCGSDPYTCVLAGPQGNNCR